jgi:predicted extracellular nuclease
MKLIFTLITLMFSYICGAQTLITKWSFDNSSNSPDSGTGSFSPEGGTAFTSYVAGNPSTGKAYGTNTYPAQSTNNEKAGIKIKVPSTGFKDLSFKFEQYNSNTASKKTVVFVSPDGVNFTKVDSIIASAGSVWTAKTIDLSSYTFLNNKTEIQILLVSGFIGSGYVASGSTSTYGTAGTWRFDNVAVYGKVVSSTKKNYIDITSSKSSLSETNKDTVSLFFKLRDTLKYNFKSKLTLSGTGISGSDYKWLTRDSVKIQRGKYADTLKFAVLDDQDLESLENISISLSNSDTNLLTGQTVNLSIADNDLPVTRIAVVQGSGSVSPKLNNLVVIEGVVTADLQASNEQGGFYMQDVLTDTLAQTSEGIFVKESLNFNVSEGDKVRVSGKVIEEFGQTILSTVTSIQILSSNQTVKSTLIKLPLDSIGQLERYEGMLVHVAQQLTVTENYQLGRYGEIQVSSIGRLVNPTNTVDPNDVNKQGNTSDGKSNAAAVAAMQSLNNRSKLLVCDKLSIQNPNPIPYMDPIEKTLRIGSLIDTLSGIMGYGFNAYRVYPYKGVLKIKYAARPTVPVFTGYNLKISSLNVLNYFNGDGKGGGYPTSRGAKTAAELVRQKAKLVAAIKAMDPDVLGLMEIENDGDSALSAVRDLVNAVNTEYGSPVFELVKDPIGVDGSTGTDAIKVAMIYKKAMVTPFGKSKGYNDSAFTLLGRPPLAQCFTLNSNSEKFTVIVNHFKSKSCSTSPADLKDLDQNDGQGCFNSTRKKQAKALLKFVSDLIKNTNDSDVVIIGDINAYRQEDPMDIIRAGGFYDLMGENYSYMFDGQSGSLDHAVSTYSMLKAKVGADNWHINCDEPLVIDYTTSFKTQDLYQSSFYRSSDHDPVMTAFNLVKKSNTLKDAHIEGFEIFPNPNNGKFTLKMESKASVNVTIFDLSGRTILNISNVSGGQELDLSNLNGVYFIQIDTENGTSLQKLFINR